MLELREARRGDPAGEPIGDPRERLQIQLIDGLGKTQRLPSAGRARGFSATTRWAELALPAGFRFAFEVEISLIAREGQPRGLGIQVVLPLDGPVTRFMVPGVLYGENRLATGEVRYPRFAKDGDRRDALTADHWSFRADRASHPLAIGWSETECVALATDEESMLGPSGLGLEGGASPAILLNFPAREEPVTYLGHPAAAPPEVMLHRWQAGEIATLAFQVYVGDPEPHGYDTILRALYERVSVRHDLQPWMSPAEAAALTAHGLYRWHYQPEAQILADTIAFEGAPAVLVSTGLDADAMHVGTAASAYALLTYGRREGIGEYATAAVAVLDTIAGALHAPTAALATLFMTRALAFEVAQGIEHPSWKAAIVANLHAALASQQNGLLWIPALLEGAAHLEGAEVTMAAEEAGAYYADLLKEEFTDGVVEDVDLAPSSTDAYHAVMAYVALFEATGAERWLALASRAADWMMTFRWSYNIAFPAHTLLQTYDFRSRGADLASPATQHLHGGGLICLPEMVRLAAHTGDHYYLERTRDNLACFLQFIAREDGDFNARTGMVTERYYNTHGVGPKGAVLPLSHASIVGLVLYACQAGLSLEG